MTIEDEFGVIDFLEDHDRGVALLPYFLQNSENIKNSIKAILPEFQELHEAALEIYKMNINNAVGVNLDNIFGEILNVKRESGQTDSVYRIALKSQVAKLTRSGEAIEIKQAGREITGIQDVSLLEVQTFFIMLHFFVDSFFDIDNGDFVKKTLRDLKVAGVYMDVGMELKSSGFRFTDNLSGGSAGEGFATLLDGSDGGTFARLIKDQKGYQLLSDERFLLVSDDDFIIVTD